MRRAPLLGHEQISIIQVLSCICLPEKEVIPIIWKNQHHSTILFALKLWSPSLHGWHLSGGRRSQSTFESILMRSASRGPSLKRCHLGVVKWRLISCFSQCTLCSMCWIQNEDMASKPIQELWEQHNSPTSRSPGAGSQGEVPEAWETARPAHIVLAVLLHSSLVEIFSRSVLFLSEASWVALVFFFASFSCRFTPDF